MRHGRQHGKRDVPLGLTLTRDHRHVVRTDHFTKKVNDAVKTEDQRGGKGGKGSGDDK